MTLDELLAHLPTPIRTAGPDPARVRIADLTDDSRTVVPGSLFIARVGTKLNGRDFIPGAVQAGAVAILTDDVDPPVRLPPRADVPIVYAGSAALASAHIAERFYGSPSTALDLIGITGTNGKTTTTHLIHQIMNGAGVRCGMIGTVVIDDGREVAPSVLTTPPAMELSRTLATMLEHTCRAAVMEVSSHSLHQHRVAALRYDVGIFTNLTRDHLDYHGTMEQYAAAKAVLFEMLPRDGWAVVNAMDPWTARMVRDCPARVLGCRIAAPGAGPAEIMPVAARAERGEPSAEAVATIRSMHAGGSRVEFAGPWGRFETSVRLLGRHNVMNALQALAAVWCAGLPPRDLEEQIALALPPPGRLEPVTSPTDQIAVLVDYAHTDDAIRQALGTLRPLVPAGAKLSIVFGCGGDRDATKRPLMGRAAAELADVVTVTSDNPRTEKPSAIIDAILSGIPGEARGKTRVDADRSRAIHHAIAAAGPGDIVLIAGKGHEDYQILPDGRGGTIRTLFDDREVARQALAARAVGSRQAEGSGAT